VRAVLVYRYHLDRKALDDLVKNVFGTSFDLASLASPTVKRKLEKDASRLAEVVHLGLLEAPGNRYGTVVISLTSRDSVEIEIKHEVWFIVSRTLSDTTRKLKVVKSLKFISGQLYDDAGERVGTAEPIGFAKLLFGEDRLITGLAVLAAIAIALPLTSLVLSLHLLDPLLAGASLAISSSDFLSIIVLEAFGLLIGGLARLIYAVAHLLRSGEVEYAFLVE